MVRALLATGAVVCGAALASLPAGNAAADVVLSLEFQERETDDSFQVTNVAPCVGVSILELSINFETAAGDLFFDSAPGEPGYPDERTEGFRVLNGATYVRDISRLEDGGKVLTVQLLGFESGARMRFAIDVDDEEGPVEGTLDDAAAPELEGTTVAVKMLNTAGVERAEVGAFEADGNASVAWERACADADNG